MVTRILLLIRCLYLFPLSRSVCVRSLSCYAVLSVLSNFAIISLGRRTECSTVIGLLPPCGCLISLYCPHDTGSKSTVFIFDSSWSYLLFNQRNTLYSTLSVTITIFPVFQCIYIACYEGTYGENCSFPCHCLNDVACHHIDGSCPNGVCAPGWKGYNCSLGKPFSKNILF